MSIPDSIRVSELVDRLVALRPGRNGRVAALVETPAPGEHVLMEAVQVVEGKGFAGDHGRKSFWKGELVPGREVTAVALEVLQALGVEPVTVGDNLITEGFDLAGLEPGDLVQAGEVLLERSNREHRPCSVFRDRSSPEAFAAISKERFRGALFTVRHGGTLRVGDSISIGVQRDAPLPASGQMPVQ